MKIHLLNGDCLQASLQAENALIVREMLVEGPIKADSWEAFFQIRADYLAKTYAIPTEEYNKKTIKEFEKIQQIPNHSEVNLWFDYDLFCFVNLLFVIQFIGQNKTLKLFLVRPLREAKFRIWRGFDQHSQADLKKAFSKRKKIGIHDLHFLKQLWNRLEKRNPRFHHPLIPFLSTHLNDYNLWQKEPIVQARWGLTEGQAARIKK